MRTFSNLMNKRRPRIRRQNIYGSPFPRASDHDSWWKKFQEKVEEISGKRRKTPPRSNPVQQRRSPARRNNQIRHNTPPERRSRDYTRAQMLQMGNSAQGPSRRVDPREAMQGPPRQGSSRQGSSWQGSSRQGSSMQGSSMQGSSMQGSSMQGTSQLSTRNNEFKHITPPAFDEETLDKRRMKHYNQIADHKKRDEPLSWKLAKECFRDQLLHGYRSSENLSEYNNERLRNDKIWYFGIEDVIKNEVFGMPSVQDSESGTWYVPGDVGVNERRLIVNRFPYHYEPEVTNYVLWYGNKNATKEEQMRMVLECEELNEYDLIVYENAPDQKSVPGIAHLQILAKKTPEHNTRTIYF